MKYLVFEAGGRAGLSAELFFANRVRKDDGNSLVMADMDTTYIQCPCPAGVSRVLESDALAMIAADASSCAVFPADELARQGKPAVFDLAARNPMVAVEKWFFNKRGMNLKLAQITSGCQINIPETFSLDDVFMRPNTMSAGSHGVGRLENTCITRRVEIAHEYVVDVNWTAEEPVIYAREVKIKNGYDKYLKFLGSGSKVARAVDEFVRAIRAKAPLMVTGIFHIQLIEDPAGQIFFVEYSKRISGTSIVNLFRGYNPFDALTGVQTPVFTGDFAKEDVWYRYEDFMMNLYKLRL
ncbi:MAG: hypothetical protein J6T09_03160 [Bacteroidales bacterium]|nr:hypothetical protein [Bacteroidales bacterium]